MPFASWLCVQVPPASDKKRPHHLRSPGRPGGANAPLDGGTDGGTAVEQGGKPLKLHRYLWPLYSLPMATSLWAGGRIGGALAFGGGGPRLSIYLSLKNKRFRVFC